MGRRHKLRILKAMKKHGFIPRDVSLRWVSHVKNYLWGRITWKELFRIMAFSAYLNDDLPDDGIYIEELDWGLGGTLYVDLPSGKTSWPHPLVGGHETIDVEVVRTPKVPKKTNNGGPKRPKTGLLKGV